MCESSSLEQTFNDQAEIWETINQKNAIGV